MLSNRAIIVHRYVHVMSATCISAFSVKDGSRLGSYLEQGVNVNKAVK